MSTLRTTRPADRTARRRWARAAALALAVGLFGCGSSTPPGPAAAPHAVGTADPPWVANRPNLPVPDADRINYDARTRTLTFYDLPGNDRWNVRLPGEPVGHPVPPRLRLPDVDIKAVMVYYTRPGMHPSVAVSVKQIQDSGGDHVSQGLR
jgi:hypothetical protein